MVLEEEQTSTETLVGNVTGLKSNSSDPLLSQHNNEIGKNTPEHITDNNTDYVQDILDHIHNNSENIPILENIESLLPSYESIHSPESVQAAECSVKQTKTKKEIIVSPLLLAYTYHLNNVGTKYVQVGFDVNDFQPTILFHHVERSYLRLNAHEFTNIFLSAEHINNFFFNYIEFDKNKLSHVSQQVLIKPSLKKIQAIFFKHKKNSKEKISLDMNEWVILTQLNNFFNALISWYRSTIQCVCQYYTHYVKLCCDKNVTHLNFEFFFTPNEIRSVGGVSGMFNYSRLFHEIPTICHKRLMQDILNSLCRF